MSCEIGLPWCAGFALAALLAPLLVKARAWFVPQGIFQGDHRQAARPVNSPPTAPLITVPGPLGGH